MKVILALPLVQIMACLLFNTSPSKPLIKVEAPKPLVTVEKPVEPIVEPSPPIVAPVVTPIVTPPPEPPRVEVPRESSSERNETLKQYAERRTNEIFDGGWANVDFIINHESGWNTHAVNRSSGSCGLGQALPCSKMHCALSDGKCQVEWVLQYISARYGSTSNAKAFWLAHNYY